ncbi:MAG TPA: PglZ domain-containing protein [Archangium sp.]|nr:PglZ domain-containing protein [Archangium sp.]
MHPLHQYLCKQLGERLARDRVVVWYDTAREFQPFITELRGSTDEPPKPIPPVCSITLEGKTVRLVEFEGSFFGVRAAVEPLVSAELPEPLLIYVPGVEYVEKNSVLLELEKAGHHFERELHKVARNVLRQHHEDADIDRLLPPQLGYADIARLVAQGGQAAPVSLLRTVLPEAGATPEQLLAAWLADEARDSQLQAKGAEPELRELLQTWLGLEPPAEAPLARLRAITVRFVLGGEFREDLRGVPVPSSVASVPRPRTDEQMAALRRVAVAMRTHHAEAYTSQADKVEAELGLAGLELPAEALGSIDTFRFEERVLLRHCGELLVRGEAAGALKLVTGRARSFWLDRDVERKAQWEACRRIAELSLLTTETRKALASVGREAGAWLAAYTAEGGWHRMDQAQRRLEAFVASMDEDPEAERALALVRRAYEETCTQMAEGFTEALRRAQWQLPGVLTQTAVYGSVVSERPRPVAYLFVDALRYEMGLELAGRLTQALDLSLRPAVASLPTITQVGMAALLPGASASFDVVAQQGRLGARIDGTFLPDLAARKKLLEARVPGSRDFVLDKLLRITAPKLAQQLEGATLVVVRSQDIDRAGEDGATLTARQTMDTVIDNLARAVRKLAAAGIEHFVLSADHGHHFAAEPKDESMRIEAPGGDTVELHRRCWAGRGGTTPPGCVRVTGAELGYATDLDFVFPVGTGVFRAGGDLAFHHGGPSLQELLVPVLSFRMEPRRAIAKAEKGLLSASGLPASITNRIFIVALEVGGTNLSLLAEAGLLVRPLLMSGDRAVGAAEMADGAALDRATGCVRLPARGRATVGFLLKDDTVDKLRVVVQDPNTDAILFQSADLPVRLGI